MKIKPRTKKIVVLSVMVVLLVATGVLNFVLNDRLTSNTQQAGNTGTVTETFFASARSEREATRESEFLFLDAIMKSETSSESAKKTAEEMQLELVERMEKELEIETLIKGKGFEDAIITISDTGANVLVGADALSAQQLTQIKEIVRSKTSFAPTAIKIMPYN